MWLNVTLVEELKLTLEIHEKPAAFEYSHVEVGRHLYGLHCGSTAYLAWV
jgi:hypothetical protein